MKSILKYFLCLVSLSFFIVIAGTVNYVMPSYDETVVTGMEVRRMDKDGVISKSNPADGEVRDVYFLFTENPDSKKTMVYRNEDTGWGLPPYFKFSSADMQAKAQAYANEHQRVQIKYYGWRITMFDEFRNALSVKEITEADSPSHPIFSYILYLVLFFTLFFSVQFIRGWFDSEN